MFLADFPLKYPSQQTSALAVTHHVLVVLWTVSIPLVVPRMSEALSSLGGWSFLTKQKRKMENGVAASGELDFLLPELPIEKAAITSVKDPLFISSFTIQKAGSDQARSVPPAAPPGSFATLVLG